jgi:hypothetical protein
MNESRRVDVRLGDPAGRLASPRLAHPEQAMDFQMVVAVEGADGDSPSAQTETQRLSPD